MKVGIKCFLIDGEEVEEEGVADREEMDRRGRVLSPTVLLIREEEMIQKKAKLPRIISRYSSTVHARPTSNMCERLFSQLKLLFNDHRHRLEPSTLEAILFLKVNFSYWDIQFNCQIAF